MKDSKRNKIHFVHLTLQLDKKILACLVLLELHYEDVVLLVFPSIKDIKKRRTRLEYENFG